MFINKNLNPRGLKTGDCAIRAVAGATGLSWDEAYNIMAYTGFNIKREMAEVETVEKVLLDRGFKVGKIKVVKGCKRPTVRGFAEQHPNMTGVMRVANHLVAFGRGHYMDIWDSGDCSVYKYWYVEH